ncbi:MAG: hypothetical protein IJD91_06235 [Clostridia bacterium]|nr:hypothetical protein [Clostridia bacterium]
MALSKETMRSLIRLKKWVILIRLMQEGEVDMPLRFKYDNFLSLKAICIRETKKADSEFMYSPHYSDGNVLIIKTRKSDAESNEQWVQAE